MSARANKSGTSIVACWHPVAFTHELRSKRKVEVLHTPPENEKSPKYYSKKANRSNAHLTLGGKAKVTGVSHLLAARNLKSIILKSTCTGNSHTAFKARSRNEKVTDDFNQQGGARDLSTRPFTSHKHRIIKHRDSDFNICETYPDGLTTQYACIPWGSLVSKIFINNRESMSDNK